MKAAEIREAYAHALKGRPCSFWRDGWRCGMIRAVTVTRGQLSSVVVQVIGGPAANVAKTYSARCGGDRHRVLAGDLERVRWRGKLRPIVDVLAARSPEVA